MQVIVRTAGTSVWFPNVITQTLKCQVIQSVYLKRGGTRDVYGLWTIDVVDTRRHRRTARVIINDFTRSIATSPRRSRKWAGPMVLDWHQRDRTCDHNKGHPAQAHAHTHCCHLPACTLYGNNPNAHCDIVKESARELWNATTGLVVADGCGAFHWRTWSVARCLWLCASAIVCVSQEIRSVKLNSFYWQLIEYTKKKQDRGREQKRVERNPRRFSNGI